MEQIQFLPFCLASPPSYEGLLAGEPSTASFLGVLRDKNNKVILDSDVIMIWTDLNKSICKVGFVYKNSTYVVEKNED